MSEKKPESNESSDSNRKEEKEGGDLENITEELENLPPEIKRVMQATLSMQRISMPLTSSIQEKINEEHISIILESVEKDSERVFKDTQEARKYSVIYIFIVLLFFSFLTVFLVNKDVAVYQEILKLLIIFGGGFGSGIGFKGYMDRKNR